MFLDKQPMPQQNLYGDLLVSVGALSRLSSDSMDPFLGYRQVENIFCKAFGARNLSRADCSIDAIKGGVGIGIKTFLNGNGSTFQKIAEINKDAGHFRGKTPKEIVDVVARIRNERLRFTKDTYGLTSMLYHCVVREAGKISVYESSMDPINLSKIRNVSVRPNSVRFNDEVADYTFYIPKSTILKRFITKNILLSRDVEILKDPYTIIKELLERPSAKVQVTPASRHVYLPLFSDRGGRGVPERSGLNQWNAKGRPRDPNEIYIPIPSWIHHVFPHFFPGRDVAFDLKLPDGRKLSAKVCQDGGKALMSNPNLALGEWLLRQVLGLAEWELLTYDKLEILGVDSVVVSQEGKGGYCIDFSEIGSYDAFQTMHKD